MELREQVRALKARTRLNLLAGFREIKHVDISEIPLQRQLFPGSKNDYWYRVPLPETSNATACVYELGAREVFLPHFHSANAETCFMLTEGAVVEVITLTECYDVNFPESFSFKKSEKHAVINKTDKKIDLLIVWTPKMKGFNAVFDNGKNK